MESITRTVLGALLLQVAVGATAAEADLRQPVDLDPAMRAIFMANMRDYMAHLDGIVADLAAGRPDAAGERAEHGMGMSSMSNPRMMKMMRAVPQDMRALGRGFHQSASRFARTAAEGDLTATLGALREVTAACVACHAVYRLR